MKYKLKIIPEDGMYVGYALENEHIKYKTEPCSDPVVASRTLSTIIGKAETPQQLPNVSKQTVVLKSGASTGTSSPSQSISSTPSRRCCGRG